MIAAVDVHYKDDGSATAAAVIFCDFTDFQPRETYLALISKTEAYLPGKFYKREMPCLMAVLGKIREDINTVIIDGYVDLGEKPGLGRYLWRALGCRKNIIGVAKKYFRGTDAAKIVRGDSKQPLYVTSAGFELQEAAGLIKNMHGMNRIPTFLKLADAACRSAVR